MSLIQQGKSSTESDPTRYYAHFIGVGSITGWKLL